LNILNDPYLKHIPFLFVFNNKYTENKAVEKLRTEINKLNRDTVNNIVIDFFDGTLMVKSGLEWLCEIMKPI
jgi:hypothetical protein